MKQKSNKNRTCWPTSRAIWGRSGVSFEQYGYGFQRRLNNSQKIESKIILGGVVVIVAEVAAVVVVAVVVVEVEDKRVQTSKQGCRQINKGTEKKTREQTSKQGYGQANRASSLLN